MKPATNNAAGAKPSEPKFFLRSKTILGALAVSVPPLARLAGIELSDADAALVADSFLSLLGVILVVWGRITARAPLALTPGGGGTPPAAFAAALFIFAVVGHAAAEATPAVDASLRGCGAARAAGVVTLSQFAPITGSDLGAWMIIAAALLVIAKNIRDLFFPPRIPQPLMMSEERVPASASGFSRHVQKNEAEHDRIEAALQERVGELWNGITELRHELEEKVTTAKNEILTASAARGTHTDKRLDAITLQLGELTGVVRVLAGQKGATAR